MIFPTILIINGLLQYQTTPTPTTMLANDLREMGFRVVEDTHFLARHADEEPVIVIGHSQGGGTALQFAWRMRREAKYNPLVITFDAAPVMRCPTRCINFQSRDYKAMPVPGAQNIDADMLNVPLVSHTLMPMTPSVRERVRGLVMQYAKPDR
jgi:pimeloyl-ACP methyl ester carboxylesterase